MLIRFILLAIVAFGFCLREASAEPQQSANILEQMPAATTVALRIKSLESLDNQLKPVTSKFGIRLPDVGQLLTDLEGVDATREIVFGLVGSSTNETVPYVLLPVLNYKAFVHAGDGDAGMEVTPLTLAGEELVATRRGTWALVTNPLDVKNLSAFKPLDSKGSAELSKFAGNELISLVTTQYGMQRLRTVVGARTESYYQRASRYRAFKQHAKKPMDLEKWKSLLAIYSNSIKRFSEDIELLFVTIDLQDDHSLALRLEAPQSSNKESAAAQWKSSEFGFTSGQVFLSGSGPWGSRWTNEVAQLYLDHFEVSSYDYGISYLRQTEFRNYRASVSKLASSFRGAQFLVINPAEGKPAYSNSAALLETKNSAGVMEAIDKAATDWNRLVESTRNRMDLTMATENLEVGQLKGKRYTMDLADAFGKEPDVAELMKKFYGRNGEWTIDVLPVDENRVLVSYLPDDLRDQLINRIASTNLTDESDKQWRLTMDPKRFQEWRNHGKRLQLRDKANGWKPKTLDSTSKVDLKVTTHEQKLSVKLDVPADVLMSVAKLWK